MSSGFKVQRSGFNEPGSRNFEPKTWNLERRKSLGLTLVELIVSIVVISAAVAGVLAVLNLSNRASATPLIQKQALSIAEALLEEVQLMPFTFCDPNDPQAETATSAAVGASGCLVRVEAIGPDTLFAPYQTANETRLSTVSPFDNVNDYGGFSMSGIVDLDGSAIAGLGAYTASVAVAQQVFNGPPNIPGPESLLITVTVTGPANVNVRLDGYRVRYAPNLLP
jgi:MSHA pilin protein MshD